MNGSDYVKFDLWLIKKYNAQVFWMHEEIIIDLPSATIIWSPLKEHNQVVRHTVTGETTTKISFKWDGTI